MLPLLVLASFILVYLTTHILHHIFLNKDSILPLPPGSMGWPYIGETLQLYSQNPNAFFSSRQRRYGDVFKTRILGCPCVMIANPEGAKFVLTSQAKLFKPTFPTSKQQIIGPQALFFHEGPYHAQIRKLALSCFQTEGIRDMVSIIEDVTLSTLQTWEGQKVNTLMEMKKFSFKVGILKIFGYQKGLDIDGLDKAYTTLEKGYNSLQINIPGTRYSKAMKARKHLRETIEDVIKMRTRGLYHVTSDYHKTIKSTFLDILMDYRDHPSGNTSSSQGLSEQQIVDNVIGVIFASRDTTASVMTWLIKFLKSSPVLLDHVIAEQQSIKLRNEQHKRKLSWEDTRNMPLTTRVILETLRVATILSFTFREAIEDVEYKGYIIPKGWKVLPLFRNIHHSPEFFPEPHKFDPSRFEVPPKPNTFMPFGNGVHACPGSELAKLEMLIFIHHLTTMYRWEHDEHKNGVEYSPFRVPQEGLPIQVERK